MSKAEEAIKVLEQTQPMALDQLQMIEREPKTGEVRGIELAGKLSKAIGEAIGILLGGEEKHSGTVPYGLDDVEYHMMFVHSDDTVAITLDGRDLVLSRPMTDEEIGFVVRTSFEKVGP